MTKQKILITAALPYANGPLHFGHIAGAYLPADCYARFQRLQGQDVLYICGSDEYGIAITLSADLAGRTPKEHVNIFHEINKDFFQKLNMSFDHYSRTSWEGHVEPTHQFFNDLLANGYIEARVTDQLYSEVDQKFLADRYVTGTCPRCGFENARGDECPRCGASYEATELKNPRSKLTNTSLTHRATKHWFLLLDRFKERLMAWVETKAWKPNVLNFIKGYINDLHPRAITRDMKWGISVPLADAEGKVLYVWFDAPIGYISATKEWAQQQGKPDLWESYWLDSATKLIQFIGKDNIPFHASIFPAMVMGQNQPYKLVDELPANEFYNLEGRQFSKSDGWFIDLEDFFKRYTTDQIRYTIAANAPETADSEFTWKDFQLRCNTELLGKYGNLVNRVLVFIRAQNGGKTPNAHPLEAMDQEFLNQIQSIVHQAAESYAQFKIRRASQLIMELAQLGNVYFDAKKPWGDAKQPETRTRMEITLSCCLECLKTMAVISYPIIPNTANQVWHLLGYAHPLDNHQWNEVLSASVPSQQSLPEPVILFKKIEDEQIEEEIKKLHALALPKETKKTPDTLPIAPLKPEITIDDVRKLDLRVGIIRAAEPVPKSKKLLKLLVDIGLEERTVVAGIGGSYRPDQLINQQVVIVANLQPATLMGVQSQGMLLAAKEGGQLELIQVTTCGPGSDVS
jgi:methionyl-tRNA synthetase